MLYPRAVEHGVDALTYWDMTYREIMAAIEGAQRRIRAGMQENALISYRQADLIAALVGIKLGSKQTAPSLREAFPGVFPELEQQALRQQNWQLMKARIDAYAAERRKRGEKVSGSNNS